MSYIIKLLESNVKLSRRNLLKIVSAFYVPSTFSMKQSQLNFTNTLDNIIVESDYPSISDDEISQLRLQAEREYKKISEFLGRRYEGTIKIELSASYKIPKANIREGPRMGIIEMPITKVLEGLPPFAHELSHLISNEYDMRRYLTEGLAVYMQEQFGENRAGPNFGEDLHSAFYEYGLNNGTLKIPMADLTSILDFNAFNEQEKKTIYLQAGSFVKYLIEVVASNVNQFMKFYQEGNYKHHFGKGLQELESDWLNYVRISGVKYKPKKAF